LSFEALLTQQQNEIIVGLSDFTVIFNLAKKGNYYVTGAPGVCPDFIQGPGVSLDVIDCPVGIDENASEQFIIFPNPAENYLQLRNGKTGAEFIVQNAIGKIFLNGKITSAQMDLNIESLSSGVYYIKSDSHTRILIKE
jgi:hypothetical protein